MTSRDLKGSVPSIEGAADDSDLDHVHENTTETQMKPCLYALNNQLLGMVLSHQ